MKCLDKDDILHDDNHLLVVYKPPGIATQPDWETAAKAWIKGVYHKKGQVYLHAVHRLDKSVGGIVVFAKTSKALSRMQALFREKKVEKTYYAIVEGDIGTLSDTLKHTLVHASYKAEVHPKGKLCILHYEVIRKEKNKTYLKIQLETGRYHQIRAQFAAIGHPVWGDVKYGSKIPYSKEGIALTHASISFAHPVSKERVTFTLEPFIQKFLNTEKN